MSKPTPLAQSYLINDQQGRRLLIPYVKGNELRMHVVSAFKVRLMTDEVPGHLVPYTVLYGREVQRIKLHEEIRLPCGAVLTRNGHAIDTLPVDLEGLRAVAQWHAQADAKLKESHATR